MKVPKVYRDLFEIAVAQGWRVEQRKNTHLSWVSPTGVKVFSSFTPSDGRAVQNLKRDLRRYGLNI
jgi:N-acetyl-anhydromuramyl-L-alanine amidase AmpD